MLPRDLRGKPEQSIFRVPSGKTPATRQPLRANIPLYRNSELRHTSKQPGLTKRGGSRVVRSAGRVAVDAAASCARGVGRAGSPCEPEASCGRAALKSGEASWRSRMSCVRQNRVVLAVVATVKPVAEMCASPTGQTASSNSRGEGGQRESSAPGRSRHKPSDHRAGKAVCSAAPVCRCAVLLRYLRTADRGCQAGTRPSLRPLSLGATERAKLGRDASRGCEGVSAIQNASRKGNCCLILRHCERSEAIHTVTAEGFRIASLRSQ
ncbi:hypothetical protein ABH973_000441 [Bradyrhizobium ottawaense]